MSSLFCSHNNWLCLGLIPGMTSKTNSGTSGQKILKFSGSTQNDLERSKKLVKMFQLEPK